MQKHIFILPIICVTAILLFSSCDYFSSNYDLLDIAQIKKVDNISELIEINGSKDYKPITPLKGLKIAKAQAKVWNENAKLIGVACPKLMLIKKKGTDAVYYQKPVLCLYLFKNDNKTWFAVSVAKRKKIEIVSAGYRKMDNGDLSNWPTIDSWKYDFDLDKYYEMGELTAFNINNAIVPVWLLGTIHTFRSSYNERVEIEFKAVNANTNDELEESIVDNIVKQKITRDKLNYINRSKVVDDNDSSLVELIAVRREHGAIITVDVFWLNNKSIFAN